MDDACDAFVHLRKNCTFPLQCDAPESNNKLAMNADAPINTYICHTLTPTTSILSAISDRPISEAQLGMLLTLSNIDLEKSSPSRLLLSRNG